MSCHACSKSSSRWCRHLRALLAAVGVLVGAAGLAQTLSAQTTWYVDVTSTCTGGCAVCGTAGAPFRMINDAINCASDGDTIIVAPGVYRAIDLGRKELVIRASSRCTECTVIDGQGVGRAVTIRGGQTRATQLIGFTIANGTARVGGGLLIRSSSPSVINCRFGLSGFWMTGPNQARCGGAVGVLGWSGIVPANPLFANCIFHQNIAGLGATTGAGGAIFNLFGDPEIVNCTFEFNFVLASSTSLGGALCNIGGNPLISNSILWSDYPDEIFDLAGRTCVDFSDVALPWPVPGPTGPTGCGASNISGNPDLLNGRIPRGSAAIDAGDDTAPPPGLVLDIDGNPRFADFDPGGSVVDMGANELPVCALVCPDFDGNGVIGYADYLFILTNWGPAAGSPADLNSDGMVDCLDLEILLAHWGLQCS